MADMNKWLAPSMKEANAVMGVMEEMAADAGVQLSNLNEEAAQGSEAMAHAAEAMALRDEADALKDKEQLLKA